METTVETATAIVAMFGNTAPVDRPPVPVKQIAGIVGAVAAIASRDTARGALAGIHVEHDEDTRGIILTATDSYRLLSVTVPGVAGTPFDPVTVAAKEMAAAVKVAAKGCAGLRVDLAGETVYLAPSNTATLLSVPVLGGTFARYRGLFDHSGDTWPVNEDFVRVNPDLWAGLLSSCATIGGYADRPKHAPLPEMDILRMSASKVTAICGRAANEITYRGLIMPLRK